MANSSMKSSVRTIKKKSTPWVKYKIAGRGQSLEARRWAFLYMPGYESEDDEGIREYIIRHNESWAQYAESYLFEMKRNVKPPKSIIIEVIVGKSKKIQWLSDEILALSKELAER